MTRSIGAALQAHFAQETTTLAVLWKLTRVDSTVKGFTNHDQDITYDSITYLAATGFTPSEISLKDDFSVTNHDVQSILDSSQITEEDIMNGLYDYAEIEVMMINYNSTSDGVIIVNRGWLGQVQIRDGTFLAEVRGLSQKVNQNIGQIYSPLCRATLGDSRCTIDLGDFDFTDSVDSVISNLIFTTNSLTQDPGWFTNGEILWTSGNNSGLRMEIKDFLAGTVTLALPMPNTIQIGDGFTIYTGCDKTFESCKIKFDNVVNFRGEPHVPGQDKVLETAGTFTSEEVA